MRPDQISPERLDSLFAAGSDTTNSQVGFTLLNTLFLREHNRVAGELAKTYPKWDDERLFQTARNVMIVLLIKIVIEEYINHITPYHFRLMADPAPFRNERWIRPNWMAIEFNLLYRWHGLIPSDAARRADLDRRSSTRRWWSSAGSRRCRRRVAPARRPDRRRSTPTRRCARSSWPASARRAPSGSRPTTTTGSWPRSRASRTSTRSRAMRRSRPRCRTSTATVDRIEFFPGLFAEDARPNSVLPSLIGRMVGVDAFSQALTNPLLSPRVFNEQTFSRARDGDHRRHPAALGHRAPQRPGDARGDTS